MQQTAKLVKNWQTGPTKLTSSTRLEQQLGKPKTANKLGFLTEICSLNIPWEEVGQSTAHPSSTESSAVAVGLYLAKLPYLTTIW